MGVVANIGLLLAIGTAIGGIVCFILSIQLMNRREELRKLRVALEKDPTPGQLAQAAQTWPETGPYTGNMLKAEYVRRAHEEESKRANTAEVVKGWVRSLFFVSVVGLAVFLGCYYGKNYVDQAPTPLPKPSEGVEQ